MKRTFFKQQIKKLADDPAHHGQNGQVPSEHLMKYNGKSISFIYSQGNEGITAEGHGILHADREGLVLYSADQSMSLDIQFINVGHEFKWDEAGKAYTNIGPGKLVIQFR